MMLDQGNVNRYNRARGFSALSFRIEADTLLLTEQGEHRLRDHDVSFVPAALDYRRISKTDRLIVIHLDVPEYHARDIECFTPRTPEPLSALFFKLLRCWEGRRLGYRHEAAAITHEIFLECYRQSVGVGEPPSRIWRSVEYMERAYTDPGLTVSAVAARSYVSEVYFRRLFKREYGISPQRYIVDLRLRHAAALIATGYHTLKEVAFLSGYTDYKYFSVEFRRQYGISPSKYSKGEATLSSAPPKG